jgi:two-component system response regulator AtoC
MIKIYCVEDDDFYASLLKHKLSLDPEYEVTVFKSAKEVIQALDKAPHIITLDFQLPDMEGTVLLKKIKEILPNVTVIALSGQNSVQVAAELFRLGAYDYIVKDESALERVWKSVHNASAKIEMSQEIDNLVNELDHSFGFVHAIKGVSPEMDRVFSTIRKTLSSDISVSIQGETGTGKELVAKAIHYNSVRKKKPFIAINLSSIPNDLIESELFGHEKGAFTGAISKREGLLKRAYGGTLFLDEIAEIPQSIQVKLLRVLQEMEMSPVGSNEKVKLDFRLITATHKNLSEEVSKGAFRKDFYFRIKGVTIMLPPLRQRGRDIIILANYFLSDFAKENKLSPKKLSKSSIKKLLNYSFPGNVRELKSLIQTAFVLSDGKEIDADDFDFDFKEASWLNNLDDNMSLDAYICQIIQHKLNQHKNIVKTAEALSIGKSTIYKLISEGRVKKVN